MGPDVELSRQNFKDPVMFKETKEVVLKNMITMIQQIRNIKNRNLKNETKSNSGIEKDINWDEKFTQCDLPQIWDDKRIHELEDRLVETIQFEKQRKKTKKNEQTQKICGTQSGISTCI